ncbi:MAG: 2-oxo acid dehydrogenase subunit E2 [Chloroflexi bacterium]|nr:2-oxo acid dehydrogenase subunit E2 [Chloroflexota bacterium]MYE40747.1 2-oxo acid dehydrogenase subunit E2 [Chloroflexota bacterium]
MASEIVLPQWGMEMQDGTIVRWLKQEGDTVAEGEPIVEVETAKLQTELESTASGVLSRIVAQEGEIVPIRGVLCVIAEPGEELAPSAAPVAPASVASEPATRVAPASNGAGSPGVQVVPAARRLARQRGVDLAQVRGSGPSGRVLLADVEAALQAPAAPAAASPQPAGERVPVVPAARRLARENDVDLATVTGSGPQGRILIEDVEAAIAARSAPPAPEPSADGVVPLTGIRGAVATRMLQSIQTTAQVTLTTEAIVTEAMQLRRGLSRHHAEEAGGSIGPLPVVVKATAEALKRHPRMNAIETTRADGTAQVQMLSEINIGLAVALDEGLVTPVIRGADGKSLAQLAAENRDLAARTREGRTRPEEISGGTFTITNLGANEIDGFTPIINPPQAGILGVGRVVEKPVIVNGEIVKGETMYLSLTFDHRMIDGAPAAAFLQTVKSLLEDPWWMVG